MQDRNNLIPRGSGWDLQQALAIKVVGQIVGRGTVRAATRVSLDAVARRKCRSVLERFDNEHS